MTTHLPTLSLTSHVIPDHHLKLVGRIIVTWSYVEKEVKMSAGKAMGLHGDQLALVTSSMNFDGWLNIIKQAIPEESRIEFQEVRQEVKRCREWRDTFAHGHWWLVEYLKHQRVRGLSLVEQRTQRKTGKPNTPHLMDGTRLENIDRQIADCHLALLEFLNKHDLVVSGPSDISPNELDDDKGRILSRILRRTP